MDSSLPSRIFQVPIHCIIKTQDTEVLLSPTWGQVCTPSVKYGTKNEITFSILEESNVEEVIDKTLNSYLERGIAFKWCIGPDTKPVDMASRLRRRGIASCKLEGMYCYTDELILPYDSEIHIERVCESTLSDYLRVFMQGWDIAASCRPALEEDCLWSMKQSSPTYEYFIARYQGEVVGTAGHVVLPDMAYLLAGQVLKQARGHGIYRALLEARLQALREQGCPLAVTQALSHSSAPILHHLGFRSAYQGELFIAEPTSSDIKILKPESMKS